MWIKIFEAPHRKADQDSRLSGVEQTVRSQLTLYRQRTNSHMEDEVRTDWIIDSTRETSIQTLASRYNSSPSSLVAMANDRYQAIVHPLTSYTWTPRAGLVHMISVWCLSLVLASPQLVIFRLAEHPSHGTKTCMAKFPGSNRTWELVYIAWNIVVQFLLPVCILIFCYCSVYIIVNQNLSMYRTTDNCKTIDLANLPSAHSRKRSNMSAPSTSTADRSSKKLLDLTVHYPSTECTHLAAGAATFSSRSSSLSSSHILRHVSHPAVLPLKRSPGDFVRSSSAVSVNDVKPRQDYAANHFLYRARLKTIKFTFIVVLTYILCSAPFYIGSIIMTLHEKFMMQKSMSTIDLLDLISPSCSFPF